MAQGRLLGVQLLSQVSGQGTGVLGEAFLMWKSFYDPDFSHF